MNKKQYVSAELKVIAFRTQVTGKDFGRSRGALRKIFSEIEI